MSEGKGLTLIELLMALAAGALLLGAVYSISSETSRAWRVSEAARLRARSARVGLEVISRELGGALVRPERGIRFVGFDRDEKGLKNGCADEVFFVAPVPMDLAQHKAATELYRFGYWLKCDELGSRLERSYQGPALEGEEYGFEGTSSQPVVSGVSDLRFRYVYEDGGWQETPGGSWDSRADWYPQDGEPDGLPAAVRVRMTVGDGKDGTGESFSIIVAIRTG